MRQTDFTHVPNFTGYMDIVFRIVQAGRPRQKILDLPAGNGLLAARLRECQHEVICGDINRAGADYVYADMNQPLPFPNAAFDICICMEGLEHVLDPAALIGELCRITRPGGRIVLTVPNIQNTYSRLKFMCTGFFYQFSPWSARHLKPNEHLDRGHISALSYVQLRYLFAHHGAHLSQVAGDRWKKKWLIPVALPFLVVGWLWARAELSREAAADRAGYRTMLADLFGGPALFSRSLILVFETRPA